MSTDAAWTRFVETMRSNQRSYFAACTEEEREMHRTCQCGLCQWLRSVDEMIAAYDEMKASQ